MKTDRQTIANTLEFILKAREEHPEWFRWTPVMIEGDDRFYVTQQDPETGDGVGGFSRPFDTYKEAKAEADRRNGGSLEQRLGAIQ
jgi:hypothetical protein